ncbi:MAG: hypothetical protein BAJATHORv1_30159 [Candidatus Thorarchaeota archaeon]|nr:MAG: hypothetical protein BAJATHORv1_30159 [Candidatus Thorarchaeota archaeon]
MSANERYPYIHHPCWSQIDSWERIHLPVARKCNVKCIYCDHLLESACHSGSRPGRSRQVMKPEEAIERCLSELSKRKNLRIVAVSGPGEPLANKETFETLWRIRQMKSDIKICLSTNGTLLSSNIQKLEELNIETISVTVSSTNLETIEQLYQWMLIDEKRVSGAGMASIILRSQIKGIAEASNVGIFIKVNTVLIPGLNDRDIIDLAKQIHNAGAKIHNIVPLIPHSDAKKYRVPTQKEIEDARAKSNSFIPQFTHCRQCRSDVVGIPGQDTIL